MIVPVRIQPGLSVSRSIRSAWTAPATPQRFASWRFGRQLIDATMARALHQYALRDHSLVAWAIWYEHPAYSGRFIAQLMAESPLPYVLVGDTLAEGQAQLPPGLVRYGRLPWYAPEVVEMWVAP